MAHLWTLCWLRLIVDSYVIDGMKFSKPGGAVKGSTFSNPGGGWIGICYASEGGGTVGEWAGSSV